MPSTDRGYILDAAYGIHAGTMYVGVEAWCIGDEGDGVHCRRVPRLATGPILYSHALPVYAPFPSSYAATCDILRQDMCHTLSSELGYGATPVLCNV
eukprot:1026927-Rhodomonas_salina.3